MSNQPLDLASFIAAIFAVFVAPPLAHIMGVYTAIVIGAVFGAGLALVRSEPTTRRGAIGFGLLMTGVSVITTVGTAELINSFLGLESISPLLAPIALLIAAIGRDWPRVMNGAWRSALRVFERRAGVPDDGGYGGGYRSRYRPSEFGTSGPAPLPPRRRPTNPDDQEPNQ